MWSNKARVTRNTTIHEGHTGGYLTVPQEHLCSSGIVVEEEEEDYLPLLGRAFRGKAKNLVLGTLNLPLEKLGTRQKIVVFEDQRSSFRLN